MNNLSLPLLRDTNFWRDHEHPTFIFKQWPFLKFGFHVCVIWMLMCVVWSGTLHSSRGSLSNPSYPFWLVQRPEASDLNHHQLGWPGRAKRPRYSICFPRDMGPLDLSSDMDTIPCCPCTILSFLSFAIWSPLYFFPSQSLNYSDRLIVYFEKILRHSMSILRAHNWFCPFSFLFGLSFIHF